MRFHFVIAHTTGLGIIMDEGLNSLFKHSLPYIVFCSHIQPFYSDDSAEVSEEINSPEPAGTTCYKRKIYEQGHDVG